MASVEALVATIQATTGQPPYDEILILHGDVGGYPAGNQEEGLTWTASV